MNERSHRYPSSFVLDVKFERVPRPTPEVIHAAWSACNRWQRARAVLQMERDLRQLRSDLVYVADCARVAKYALERLLHHVELAMRSP